MAKNEGKFTQVSVHHAVILPTHLNLYHMEVVTQIKSIPVHLAQSY